MTLTEVIRFRNLYMFKVQKSKLIKIIRDRRRQTTTDDRRQTTDDRRQTTDDRRQTTDDRRQTTDDRRQTTDDRRQTTDDRRQTTDKDAFQYSRLCVNKIVQFLNTL